MLGWGVELVARSHLAVRTEMPMKVFMLLCLWCTSGIGGGVGKVEGCVFDAVVEEIWG